MADDLDAVLNAILQQRRAKMVDRFLHQDIELLMILFQGLSMSSILETVRSRFSTWKARDLGQ